MHACMKCIYYVGSIGYTPVGSTCELAYNAFQVTESELSPECPDEQWIEIIF